MPVQQLSDTALRRFHHHHHQDIESDLTFAKKAVRSSRVASPRKKSSKPFGARSARTYSGEDVTACVHSASETKQHTFDLPEHRL
jgi:hypothetical protein